VWLQADPNRLEQVFVNLLFNAAKYTEAGGKVELSVEREEAEATVRIRDTGIGIAPDVLPHVFDLFVQANPSSRPADAGHGIGLALVPSLVESHGGRVNAASAGLRHAPSRARGPACGVCSRSEFYFRSSSCPVHEPRTRRILLRPTALSFCFAKVPSTCFAIASALAVAPSKAAQFL
jgi:signal transduction histidine kinase